MTLPRLLLGVISDIAFGEAVSGTQLYFFASPAPMSVHLVSQVEICPDFP